MRFKLDDRISFPTKKSLGIDYTALVKDLILKLKPEDLLNLVCTIKHISIEHNEIGVYVSSTDFLSYALFHIDDLDDVHILSSEIVNPSLKLFDEDLDKEVNKFITYLESTYGDKYEGDTNNYAKQKLLSKEGKSANIFTALKYIKRYDTVGYKKSENIQDLYKAMHYLLFELQRKTIHG
jgi:hypothetical protein